MYEENEEFNEIVVGFLKAMPQTYLSRQDYLKTHFLPFLTQQAYTPILIHMIKSYENQPSIPFTYLIALIKNPHSKCNRNQGVFESFR